MGKWSVILWILVVSLSFESKANELAARIINFAKNTNISWQIYNEFGHPIYTSEEYNGADTSFLSLDAEQNFVLNVQTSNICAADTLLLHLELNGSPVIVVLPENEAGEYSYPFFTGTKDNVLKIVGGTNVDIADYPWQIYLKADKYMCGGIIISNKWILTAAHCTLDENGNSIDASKMEVTAGATNPYSATSKHHFDVKRYIRHSDYNDVNYYNDVAVLELNENLNIANADAISLLSVADEQNGDINPGVMAIVTGWGKLRGVENPKDEDFPIDLQMVQLPIVSTQTAKTVWRNASDRFIFAGYERDKEDSCGGDSGGPFVVDVNGEPKLAGVVSWGSEDCSTYGAYSRITYYLDWIENNTDITPDGMVLEIFGDTTICESTNVSDYYCTEGDSGTFEWSLSPKDAGELNANNKNTSITWNKDFTGEAVLTVKAKIDGEETALSYKTIIKSLSTRILATPKDTAICQEEYLDLEIEAQGYALTYDWYKDDEFWASYTSNHLEFSMIDTSDAGVYKCIVNGACGEDISESFTINVTPKTEVIEINKCQQKTSKDDACIVIDVYGDNLSYQWLKDGEIILGANDKHLDIENLGVDAIGNYQVIVNGTCSSDTSELEYVYFNNSFYSEPLTRIYPVVADESFDVYVNSEKYYSLDLINIEGEILKSESNLQFHNSINVSGLRAGIYFVKITDNADLYTITKIIVK